MDENERATESSRVFILALEGFEVCYFADEDRISSSLAAAETPAGRSERRPEERPTR
ncbi:MAG: hypothetical protein HY721_14595 [Planctomycetes bacterium]|nr:hypothetical protein [Planctomycetota bacterium]